MMRCDVCGRSLVGLRADHPFHCKIEAALRKGAEIHLEEELPIRTTIREGDALDPFAPEELRNQVIAEGPVQRGTKKVA